MSARTKCCVQKNDGGSRSRGSLAEMRPVSEFPESLDDFRYGSNSNHAPTGVKGRFSVGLS